MDGDRRRRVSDRRRESGAGQRAINFAVGAPNGVEATRAIKLEPDESAWDVERLECEGAQRAENIVAGRRSFANSRAGGDGGQGGVPGPRQVYNQKETRDGQTLECHGCLAIATANN